MSDEPPIPPLPPTDAEIRARQLGRAKVMAWLLAAFVVLVFAISIVKIQSGHG
ncbi:MAG: hypothetical protein WDN44_06680 [Sphingomonas sp.]